MKEQNKNEWNELAIEVDAQTVKQKLYDNLLFDFCGDVSNKRLLDFGCGSGEIALRAQKNGANVNAYDLSENMRDLAIKKLGKVNVYDKVEEIPSNGFDIVFSNLVICIVDKAQVTEILDKIFRSLINNGIAYVGFCNPLSYNISESTLQKRVISGEPYSKEHEYRKLIKEGQFEITEKHRPLEFYEKAFLDNNFVIGDVRISKEGSDFIIYKLKKIKHEK